MNEEDPQVPLGVAAIPTREALAQARKEVMESADALCLHCNMAHAAHAQDKCLYTPTTFRPCLCKGCLLPFLQRSPRERMRRDIPTSGGYHWDCVPKMLQTPEEAAAMGRALADAFLQQIAGKP